MALNGISLLVLFSAPLPSAMGRLRHALRLLLGVPAARFELPASCPRRQPPRFLALRSVTCWSWLLLTY